MLLHDRARHLLARRRQQAQTRRAALLERSGQEVNRAAVQDAIARFS
ncbi:MAG: hypothetical protein IGR92_09255 [Leptolyngbyaceae cyanobacterium T60_A2020_046]|nr:hypothetical protein [Leptolyngbyaceae cyanobacterium T60_A2020_046]